MIKKFTPIFLLLFLFNSTGTNAQFINLQITIESELSATVEQPLSFGTQLANSGEISVGLGDVNMGIFGIRAFHTQNLYLELNFPQYLINENPAIDDRIPLNLNIAYNNSGVNEPRNATILSDNNGYVRVHENTSDSYKRKVWEIIYLYIYGSIDIGRVENGVYVGDAVLVVTYD